MSGTKTIFTVVIVSFVLMVANGARAQENSAAPALDPATATIVLDNLLTARVELAVIFDTLSNEKNYPGGKIRIAEVLTGLVNTTIVNNELAISDAATASQGGYILLTDTYSTVVGINADISSVLRIEENNKSLIAAILAPALESARAAGKRAQRRHLINICILEALLTEDEEYATMTETSCSDGKDNDCDGTIDCGFFSHSDNLDFEADTDCACGP